MIAFRFSLFKIITLSSLLVSAQGILDTIPRSMKTGANEIVLSESVSYTIHNVSESSLDQSYEALIMNRYARDRNRIALYYDQFRKLKDVTVEVFDISGKVLETFSEKDFGDFTTKSFSLASDNRVKYLEIKQNRYPYKIKVSYSYDFSGSLFYPSWQPQSAEKQSVLSSSIQVKSFAPVRYREVNGAKIASTDASGWYLYEGKVENLPAFETESFAEPGDYSPTVLFAPNQFEMDGYQGTMSSWEEFGKWQQKVNSGRNTLTSDMVSEVLAQIPPDASTEEKIRFVYDYLQQTTRYVSIQLGIGGWQPFETGYTHEQKFGDCKALSLYTLSLLEMVGVEAFYTTIYAGETHPEIFPDFPINKANHIVLTVPTENDTLWLECTSQINPFGYLGTFTSDRKALMITPEGGKLIQTRSYSAGESRRVTSAEMVINEDGSGSVEFNRSYSGIQIESKGFDYYSLRPESEQRLWFIDNHKWGSLSLTALKIVPPSDEVVPTARLEADFSMNRAAISSGKRLFFSPAVFSNADHIEVSKGERIAPITVRYALSEIDSLEIVFPSLYHVESPVSSVSLESKFGTFRRTVEQQDTNKFRVIRYFELRKGKYPAEDYDAFRDFISTVQKFDRVRMVLVNKT